MAAEQIQALIPAAHPGSSFACPAIGIVSIDAKTHVIFVGGVGHWKPLGVVGRERVASLPSCFQLDPETEARLDAVCEEEVRRVVADEDAAALAEIEERLGR